MPGRDRTGPLGMGPGTGWSMGPCSGFVQARMANWGPGRRFPGRAEGCSAWTATAGGHGWRHWYYATGLPRWARWPAGVDAMPGGPTREQAIAALKEEAGWLKDQLEAISRRLDELTQE